MAPLQHYTPDAMAALARQALETEVQVEPKPGLVCPGHNGAHADMSLASFLCSARALAPYFAECFRLGLAHGAQPAATLLPALRQPGVAAETTMLAATGGVNTHKGAIFSLGLLCAACGLLQGQGAPVTAQAAAAGAAACAAGIVQRELAPLQRKPPDRPLSAGEHFYLRYGIAGVRREAEQGFPAALRAFDALLTQDADLAPELALPNALLRLMTVMEDTNLLRRGSMDGLRYAQAEARAALQAGGMRSAAGRERVLGMRDDFARRNLSPGGSADMLILVIFFSLLERPAPAGACC